jgi:membrane-associated phospholipid phosphatase
MNEFIFFQLHNFALQSPLVSMIAVFCAQWLPWIVLVVAKIIIIRHVLERKHPSFSFLGRWLHEIISIIITMLLVLTITKIIKELVAYPRPFLGLDIDPLLIHGGLDSFPSGHAAIFFALAGVMGFYEKKTRWFFLISAIIIGIARIMVGVHYPLDILVGAGIGFATAWLVHRYIKNRVSTTFFTKKL